MGWLEVTRGAAPLIVSFPHTGIELPESLEPRLTSAWLARKDADWWVEKLYDFAASLGATTIRTAISRTCIDVNRDPSGASLYPGQATTGLCPTTSFDGEPLYRSAEPDAAEIEQRRHAFFDPYHAALESEITRLKANYGKIVLYDAHSIRSLIPRLFDGELSDFNIGSNKGASCDPDLAANIEATCSNRGFSVIANGRFKGGWITRRYGRPQTGVHAIQMELACRGYLDEPRGGPTPETWPPPYDAKRAAPMRTVLVDVLNRCLEFAEA